MASTKRIIEKYVNVDTAALVSSDNGTPRDGNSATLFVGTQNIMRMHLNLADGVTPFIAEAGATWFFGVDDTYGGDHADYVVTNTIDFNNIADWADMDIAAGKICFPVNMASSTLKAYMAKVSSKEMIGELWYAAPGTSGEASLLLQMKVTVKNIVTDMGDESELVYSTTGILRTSGNDIILLYPDGSVAQRWSKV